VSLHASADGTLVRANASFKSFAPIEDTYGAEEFMKASATEIVRMIGSRMPATALRRQPTSAISVSDSSTICLTEQSRPMLRPWIEVRPMRIGVERCGNEAKALDSKEPKEDRRILRRRKGRALRMAITPVGMLIKSLESPRISTYPYLPNM
jgi:hypothetical protein